VAPPVVEKPAPASTPTPANAPPEIPADSASHCNDRWKDTRDRLQARHCLLLELLGKLSWRALREATLLVQEMREDIYEEDILAEIVKKNQAEISFDTQKARPLQPVFFSVKFNNSRFNNAAALQRLMCHWIFPDSLDEYTWKVCHYFSGYEHDTVPPESGQALPPGGSTSSASDTSGVQRSLSYKRPHSLRFSRPAINRDLVLYASIRGQRVDESNAVPVPALKKVIQIQSPPTTERSRFWAEILQFAIAFGIALAGLVSGGLEQLQKLDIIPASIAIIGLGFSASAIKNLLTQSATTQAPTPAPTAPPAPK
jgi:hypothetical protein